MQIMLLVLCLLSVAIQVYSLLRQAKKAPNTPVQSRKIFNRQVTMSGPVKMKPKVHDDLAAIIHEENI